MAIRTLEDSSVRVVELGLGTTGISQVFVGGDNISSGIAFTNSLKGVITDEDVIVEIVNLKGVYAYFRAIFDLLEIWQLNNNVKKQLKELSNLLTQEINKETQ